MVVEEEEVVEEEVVEEEVEEEVVEEAMDWGSQSQSPWPRAQSP